MDFKKAVSKLEKHPVFKGWRADNKSAFLSSAFIMIDESKRNEWMIDYYDKGRDKIVSFMVSDKVKLNPESEVFKSGKEIKEVAVDEVKLAFDKVLELGSDFCKKNFPKEVPKKTIAILQNLELGQVWNITYITLAYKTINIKISSSTGEVLKHGMVSLYDFIPKDK